MKDRARIKLLMCLFFCAVAPALPAGSEGTGETVITGFVTLIGFPSGDQPTSGVATLVPGTVIPLIPGTDAPDQSMRRDAVQKSLSFTKAVEKLWSTFRLDPSRQLQEIISTEAAAGRTLSIPVPRGLDLKIMATLVSFDDTMAKYRIVFQQGEKSLADSTVPVARGGRAVVGGLNGATAPYIFLFIEPNTAPKGASDAERLREGIDIKHPVILTRTMPQYPSSAAKEGVSGMVQLEVTLGSDGLIRDIAVLDSSDPRLTDAAIAAIKQWTFEPARLPNGNPVAAIMAVSFRFFLK